MTDATQDAPLSVNAQYIKDLSFELPDPVSTFQDSASTPDIEIGVNVSVNPKAERTNEVVLHITVNATREKEKLFLLELEYGGIFTIGESVPEEAVNPITLIECPRLLFPYARAIVSNVTREAGFPALNLNPIDFVELYRRQIVENSNNNNIQQ